MERFSFFDAQNTGHGHDRTYNSADIAAYFSSFIGNGVYANPANQLKVEAGTGLGLKVKQGKAWINGYFYELSEADKDIVVERGDNNYARIDSVVLSLNHSKRLVELKLIKGAAAAVPQAPSFSRTKDVHDLVLAEITIPAGTTDVRTAQIKDCRPDNSKCGFVTGVVDQIDTTGLFAQYDDEFKTWFDGIKGTLSGDVAGKFGAQIAEHDAKIKANEAAIAKNNETDTAQNQLIITLQEGQKNQLNYITQLQKLIKMGTEAAPETGEPNTIYIQLL